jgi:hypothetical protein
MEAIYCCMTLHCTKIMLLVIKSPTNYGFHFFPIEVDKVYQLLAHVRWFSPGTSASYTTKIGRHDIAEILLKVTQTNQIKSNLLHMYNFLLPIWYLLIFLQYIYRDGFIN